MSENGLGDEERAGLGRSPQGVVSSQEPGTENRELRTENLEP